jgi:hypothetical protein
MHYDAAAFQQQPRLTGGSGSGAGAKGTPDRSNIKNTEGDKTMPHYNTENAPPVDVPIPADYSRFDSVDDIVRDAAQWGLLEELRDRLCGSLTGGHEQVRRIARDISFELAGAKNRALAVDVFLHATGIAEFGVVGLRDYAAAHGCSHEWFRRQVIGMCGRLGLPLPSSFEKEFDDAA